MTPRLRSSSIASLSPLFSSDFISSPLIAFDFDCLSEPFESDLVVLGFMV